MKKALGLIGNNPNKFLIIFGLWVFLFMFIGNTGVFLFCLYLALLSVYIFLLILLFVRFFSAQSFKSDFLLTIFLVIVDNIIMYSRIYELVGLNEGGYFHHPSAFTSLYFSVITVTTLGYGDLTPVGIGRLAAATEALFGYFSLALLIAGVIKALEANMTKKPGGD